MKFILDILRGFLIGIANIIPGVSGGTMMVSMGIYDNIIYCITHIFKQFIKSIKILLPYFIGMILGIGGGAILLSFLFKNYPLPTNVAFIGLILGGIPAITKHMDKKKVNAFSIFIGILFFALVIGMQLLKANFIGVKNTLEPNLVNMILMMFLGAIASATMVIPGVSGSMVMVLLGYYDSLLSSVSSLLIALKSFALFDALNQLLLLAPFGIGVLIGIFFVAKLIEFLLKNYFTYTYCGILGLVFASPIVVLLNVSLNSLTILSICVSIATFALGYKISLILADDNGHNLK